MSDLVKTQTNKPTKKRSVQPLPTEVAEVPSIESGEGSLSDVAIMAADAEFATAIRDFDDRYAHNLKRFGAHIRSRQSQVVNAFKQEIKDVYCVDEAAMYGEND